MIKEEKRKALFKRMKETGLFEEDILEKFIIGSGRGGQKRQKTHSCVYLKHIPSNLEVKCQKTRIREDNRFFARKLLLEAFEKKVLKIETKKEKVLKKIKKQKKRRRRKVLKKNQK